MAEGPHLGDEERELDDEGLEELAQALATPPPPELRARVLAAVQERGQLDRVTRRLRRWRVGGLAAAAAACVMALLYAQQVRVAQQHANTISAMLDGASGVIAHIEAQRREIAERGDALLVHAEVIRIISSPNLKTAPLDPMAGHTGSARVLLDPISGAVALVGVGLPPAKPGEVYELWALRGDAPERAGEFETDPSRQNFALRLRHVRAPSEVTAFAVSLESKRGLAAPQGPIVLMGSIES